jgi:acyl carrier protein
MEDIKATLRNYIAENILFSGKKFPYGDDVSFLENGIVDSMNIMEIVIYVEEHFGIQIDDEDILPENFDSISRLANFVMRKKAPQQIPVNLPNQSVSVNLQ